MSDTTVNVFEALIPEIIAEDRLLIIWSSADRDVAQRMVFMYARNAKLHSWWHKLQLCIWGPSAKLISEDDLLQLQLQELQQIGVEITACIACANSYGVTDKLRELGITVQGMGQPLTEMLKGGWKVLTF